MRIFYKNLSLTIFFILSIVYLPFMTSRVIRTAGDDKVYISQTLEMIDHGHWFLQTYAGKPNYFKGPFHYLAIRLGTLLFGMTMLATVYMNYLLLLFGALALASLVRKYFEKEIQWALWIAIAFALGPDLYAHAFASQMEVELAGFFAMGAWLLDRTSAQNQKTRRHFFASDLHFWILAGIVGWIKSPIHALLLGFSGVLFWMIEGTLLSRLKSKSAWGYVFIGIGVCCLGYLPAAAQDWDQFFLTYIHRENLDKHANGGTWYQPLVPILTYSVLPWSLLLLGSYADGLKRLILREPVHRLTQLGFAIAAPCLIFFSYHPYRTDNYDLPALSGLLLMGTSLILTAEPRWKRLYQVLLRASLILLLVGLIGLQVIVWRLQPWPAWWPKDVALWFGAAMLVLVFKMGSRIQQSLHQAIVISCLFLFIGSGTLMASLGEYELIDLRSYLQQSLKSQKPIQVAYFNLGQNIWSEWGYMNYALHWPVVDLYSEDQLKKALLDGDLIILPYNEQPGLLKQFVQNENLPVQLKWTPWTRWRSQGRGPKGETVWKMIWTTHTLEPLKTSYWMVQAVPVSAHAE